MPAMVASASAASDPTGIWINDTGRGAIEIKECGNALCGNVVWVKDAADAKGCGKQIIGNVAPVGGGRWDNGWIYSPERGRKYNVELQPLANGTLRVTGYAGLRFLSKTMIWTRAPENLQLCGKTENQIEAKSGQPANAKPDASSTAAATAPAADPNAANAKPAPNPQVAVVTPPPAPTPSTTPTDKPAAKAANGDAASPATGTDAKDASKPQSEPPPAAAASKDAKPADTPQKDEETASADDGSGSDLEQKLNGLGLGKVFTKTKSGKCKLDLPWVKLTIDCEH
jgi:hypothetical protein